MSLAVLQPRLRAPEPARRARAHRGAPRPRRSGTAVGPARRVRCPYDSLSAVRMGRAMVSPYRAREEGLAADRRRLRRPRRAALPPAADSRTPPRRRNRRLFRRQPFEPQHAGVHRCRRRRPYTGSSQLHVARNRRRSRRRSLRARRTAAAVAGPRQSVRRTAVPTLRRRRLFRNAAARSPDAAAAAVGAAQEGAPAHALAGVPLQRRHDRRRGRPHPRVLSRPQGRAIRHAGHSQRVRRPRRDGIHRRRLPRRARRRTAGDRIACARSRRRRARDRRRRARRDAVFGDVQLHHHQPLCEQEPRHHPHLARHRQLSGRAGS